MLGYLLHLCSVFTCCTVVRVSLLLQEINGFRGHNRRNDALREDCSASMLKAGDGVRVGTMNSMCRQFQRLCLVVAAALVLGVVGSASAQLRVGVPFCSSCCSNPWPYLSGWMEQAGCDTLNVYVCDYTEGLHSVTARIDSQTGPVVAQAQFYLAAPANGICGAPTCMHLSLKLPTWATTMDRNMFVNATSPNPYVSQGFLPARATGVSPLVFDACPQPTPTPTCTPVRTATPTPTLVPTKTPTPVPSKTPTPAPTKTPSPQATATPTPELVTLALTPIAECIDKNLDGSYTARFGYRNTGTLPINVAVGNFNGFSPAPIDRGQPKTFNPGQFNSVFSAVFPAGSSLSWLLGNAVVQVSQNFKPCSGPVCEETQIGEILTFLDTNALKQDANVKQFVRRIKRNAPNDKALMALADSLKRQSAALYRLQWEGVWTKFSSTAVFCQGVGCAQVDQQDNIDAVVQRSVEHLALSTRAANALKKARRGSLARDDKRLLSNAQKLHKENKAKAEELPRFESQCS